MQRSLLALAVLLLACAHAPAPPEVEVEARAEAGEDQTAPVRKSCKGRGPRIPEGETVTGLVRAIYVVGADGRVSDVSVTGKASPGALKAIQRYIASCTYTPALRDGKPVPVRWRGELSFPGTR